jgi:hypothetical protein
VLNMDSNPKWEPPAGWEPVDASKPRDGFIHAPFSPPQGAVCPEGRCVLLIIAWAFRIRARILVLQF